MAHELIFKVLADTVITTLDEHVLADAMYNATSYIDNENVLDEIHEQAANGQIEVVDPVTHSPISIDAVERIADQWLTKRQQQSYVGSDYESAWNIGLYPTPHIVVATAKMNFLQQSILHQQLIIDGVVVLTQNDAVYGDFYFQMLTHFSAGPMVNNEIILRCSADSEFTVDNGMVSLVETSYWVP